jgi:hypothetical protein
VALQILQQILCHAVQRMNSKPLQLIRYNIVDPKEYIEMYMFEDINNHVKMKQLKL